MSVKKTRQLLPQAAVTHPRPGKAAAHPGKLLNTEENAYPTKRAGLRKKTGQKEKQTLGSCRAKRTTRLNRDGDKGSRSAAVRVPRKSGRAIRDCSKATFKEGLADS